MTTTDETFDETFIEYRIESRDPKTRRWRFIPASHCSPTRDLSRIERGMKIIRAHAAPGWSFRIAAREVRIVRTESPWRAED